MLNEQYYRNVCCYEFLTAAINDTQLDSVQEIGLVLLGFDYSWKCNASTGISRQ
jgi:hypothetical protein